MGGRVRDHGRRGTGESGCGGDAGACNREEYGREDSPAVVAASALYEEEVAAVGEARGIDLRGDVCGTAAVVAAHGCAHAVVAWFVDLVDGPGNRAVVGGDDAAQLQSRGCSDRRDGQVERGWTEGAGEGGSWREVDDFGCVEEGGALGFPEGV